MNTGYVWCMNTMSPPEKIRATAEFMVEDGLKDWQEAQVVLAEKFGWKGAAIRIAAVQAMHIAAAIRAGNA